MSRQRRENDYMLRLISIFSYVSLVSVFLNDMQKSDDLTDTVVNTLSGSQIANLSRPSRRLGISICVLMVLDLQVKSGDLTKIVATG